VAARFGDVELLAQNYFLLIITCSVSRGSLEDENSSAEGIYSQSSGTSKPQHELASCTAKARKTKQ